MGGIYKMSHVQRQLSIYSICLILIFAPIYQARAVFPAIGSVITSVVGATVIDAGATAVLNVVAGKSPWGASDNVFGGKIKVPVRDIGNWVKKQGKSIGFWSAALILAGYFMDQTNQINHLTGLGSCGAFSSSISISGCKDKALNHYRTYYSPNYYFDKSVPIYYSGSLSSIDLYFFNPKDSSSIILSWLPINISISSVSDSDFDKFTADALSKIGYGDNPFTPKGQQYPVYPVDGQMWPTTVTPITPPMKPNKPWPTPVPSPQPIPTPGNPAFPSTPDTTFKPYPLPDHTGVDVPPINPPVTGGTEIKPLPDGGFEIPNPLPVTVNGPVDVTLLNQLEQGLTIKQLSNYHDTAAGSLTEAPAAGTGDGISDLTKAYDDLIKNKMNFTIPTIPSPYQYFNFDMGGCQTLYFSASISGDSKRIPVNENFCKFYDGIGRPAVSWVVFMLTVLYIYLLTMRTVRSY